MLKNNDKSKLTSLYPMFSYKYERPLYLSISLSSLVTKHFLSDESSPSYTFPPFSSFCLFVCADQCQRPSSAARLVCSTVTHYLSARSKSHDIYSIKCVREDCFYGVRSISLSLITTVLDDTKLDGSMIPGHRCSVIRFKR